MSKELPGETTAIYTQVADETLNRAVFGIPGAA